MLKAIELLMLKFKISHLVLFSQLVPKQMETISNYRQGTEHRLKKKSMFQGIGRKIAVCLACDASPVGLRSVRPAFPLLSPSLLGRLGRSDVRSVVAALQVGHRLTNWKRFLKSGVLL